MNYKNLSLKIRKSVLKIANSSQCSHIGSNLSVVDILSVLYSKFLKNSQLKQKKLDLIIKIMIRIN